MKLLCAVALTAFLLFEIIGSPKTFIATAYHLRGQTASGTKVRKGIVAADPKILPLGSIIHVDTGEPYHTGIYRVEDTGKKIKANRLDIWMQNRYNTIRFGVRKVTVRVLYRGTNNSKRGVR